METPGQLDNLRKGRGDWVWVLKTLEKIEAGSHVEKLGSKNSLANR